MPKKRFRFDNKYLYGSAAFVVGFGGVMSLLVSFAPVNVPNANIATVSEASQSKEVAEEPASTSQGDKEAQPASPQPTNTAPVAPQPNPMGGGAVVAPTTPNSPVTPTTPDSIPVVVAPPVVEEPEILIPIVPEVISGVDSVVEGLLGE